MGATSAGGGEPLVEVVEQAIEGSLDGHCTHLSSLGGFNAFNHHIDSRGGRSTAVATHALKLHQTCILLQQLFHQPTACDDQAFDCYTSERRGYPSVTC